MYSVKHLRAARNHVESNLEDRVTLPMLNNFGSDGQRQFYEIVYTLAEEGARISGAPATEAAKIAEIVRGEY